MALCRIFSDTIGLPSQRCVGVYCSATFHLKGQIPLLALEQFAKILKSHPFVLCILMIYISIYIYIHRDMMHANGKKDRVFQKTYWLTSHRLRWCIMIYSDFETGAPFSYGKNTMFGFEDVPSIKIPRSGGPCLGYAATLRWCARLLFRGQPRTSSLDSLDLDEYQMWLQKSRFFHGRYIQL